MEEIFLILLGDRLGDRHADLIAIVALVRTSRLQRRECCG